jgi:hypothetical protein
MKNRLFPKLHRVATLALAIAFLIHLPALAQTANKSIDSSNLPSTTQSGNASFARRATPQRNAAPTKAATTLSTPFDRVIAPHLDRFMKQGTPAGSAKLGKAAQQGQRAAAGVNGSAINFPGFVSAPFVTLNDGSSAPADNTVSGDFNNDGRMDVATVRTDGAIDVLLNPGSFTNIGSQSPVISNSNGNADSLVIAWVVVADMNGDGFPDLVGQDAESSQIVVWIGKGDGTFSAPNFYPVTLPSGVSWTPGLSYGASIVVGDFNGDGTLDVAAVTLSANYVPSASNSIITEQTFLNNGQGTLIPLADENTTFNDYYFTDTYANASVTTVDGVRASGIAFLVEDAGINDSTKSGISVATLQSNGDGTFAPAVEPSKPLVLDYLINVYGAFQSTNLATSVKGNSTNKPTPSGTPGSGAATTDIVFMTGDGAVYDAPFTTGNPTAANVLVGLNTQLFAFGGPFVPPVTTPPTPPSLIATPIPNQATINVADMNNDGLADLVVYATDVTYIYPNAGKGVFTAAPTQVAGATPGIQEPQPANYDGSSYNSFIDVDFALSQVGYFQNLGAAASTQSGQFQAAPLVTGTNTGNNSQSYGGNIEVVTTADVNGDGVPDLIGLDLSGVANGATNIVLGIRNSSSGPGNQSSNYTFTTAVKGQDLYNISNGLVFMEPVAISNSAGTSIIIVAYAGGPFLVTIGKDGKASKPTALNMGTVATCPLNYADVGDINNDGVQDIVFAYGGDMSCYSTNGTPSGYYTLLGNADGTFQTGKFTPFGSSLYQVKLINFSGVAGNLDLVLNDQDIRNLSSGVYVIPNKGDGSGTFDSSRGSLPVPNYVVSDIIAGDYNSDGKQDLTLTTVGEFQPGTGIISPNTAGVLLLAGNGNYTFGTPVLTDPGNYPLWGSYADFNGDGAPDLALVETYNIYNTQAFTPAVQVLPNLGGGTFGPPIVEMNSFMPTKNSFVGYTFTGNFTNTGGSDLLVSSNDGTTEFVNQGVTTLTLTANTTSPGQGAPVTLTAVISQATGASTATGAVSFYSNGTLLGSSPIASGTASLTTAALPVGSNSISAVYAGDSLHNQATASITLSVTAVSPAFALSASSATLTLTSGATGSVTLNLAANSTFGGAIAFTCSGAPTEASCTINPSSLTLASSQTGNVTVTIATTAKNNQYQASNNLWQKTAGGLSLAGLLLFIIPRRRRFANMLGVLVLALFSLGAIAALSGCGSSSNKYPGTPAGASTLTVTATSGSITQTQTIALTVTQAQQ